MVQWLDGKTWLDITREERNFCADLYLEIRDHPKEFVRFINECHVCSKNASGKSLNETENWEVAYEMAYYRDLRHSNKAKGHEAEGNKQRKFDLALISDRQLVIVEAKAQGGFSSDDIKNYKKDLADIRESREDQDVSVFLVLLCSSRWFCSKNRKVETKDVADYVITWKDLAGNSSIVCSKSKSSFCRAEKVYGDKPASA